MTEIKIKNIQKSFINTGKEVRVLENISLDIAPGEFFFLLGPSGCGKTTLLRIIAGLIEPTTGGLFFDGKDVTNLDARKRNCSLVFQNYALWPHLTVLKNTEFGLEMKGFSKSVRREAAMKSLELVEMAEYWGRKPTQLSGGQQQRVALARAITARPDCLLLDEPLSNLDAKLRIQMRQQLRRLVKTAGYTAIYVTHDQKEALSMADRIAVLNDGVIEQIGTPREVYEKPKTAFVAKFIGECNSVQGQVLERAAQTVVQSAFGKIIADAEKDSSNQENVLVVVRPENISIHTEQPKTETNVIEAVVDTITYLGEITQAELRMPQGSKWKVFMLSSSAGNIQPQQKVHISIPCNSVIVNNVK